VTRYLLTTDAGHDIDAIKIYLVGQGGPALVRHVMDRLEAALQLLGDTPGIGHIRFDLTHDPVKFWQVFSYFVI
jgi:plasmid stabilization system protein ParE